MNHKHSNCILLTVLLLNPLLLLLLSRSWGVTAGITFMALLAALGVSMSNSLRLKVWAFNLCAITSIALHAELLFREFLPEKNIPNLYELHGRYYFNKQNLNQEFRTNEYVSSYKTNCQGYRMDELTNRNVSINTCDWLFIGDSYTQGAQVDYSELYSSRLFSSFPNKVIVNAGISGAGLYDELHYFKDKGKLLSPKIVFLQIGVFNDFFNVEERKATYQDYLMEMSDLYRYLAYNVFSSDSLPLGRWTEPFFPTKAENCDYNILYKEESEVKMADKQAFVTCLTQWKKEVEKIGAKLILILIPSKEQISPDLLKQVTDRYHITPNQLDMTAPNRLFARTASRLGVQAIDLTDEFKQAAVFPFFAQDEHLNSVGHRLIADALAHELNKYSEGIQYVSASNSHERYPMFYRQDSTLLYQGQDANHYFIYMRGSGETEATALVSSYEELVHPALSPDFRYLAYTEGHQESNETDVVLWDKILNTSQKLNPDNCHAAIPMFNHEGTMIAMPVWDSGKGVANIGVYDMLKKRFVLKIPSDKECWRPIFNRDDKSIFFIKKEKYFNIKQYDMENSQTKDVLSLPFDIWDISLSPSGKYLVFAGNKDGNWDLFSYSFATNKVRQLTRTMGDEWDPAFGATDQELWYAGTFGFNDGIFYKKIE